MTRSWMLGAALFVSAGATFGQLTDREIGEMRKSVGVPGQDQVRTSKIARLPNQNLTKVFFSVKTEDGELKRLKKRIAEWNLDNAPLRIEETAKLEDAEIVVVHFVSERTKIVEEASLKVGLGQGGVLSNNAPHLGRGDGFRTLELPIYSYLIKRDDTVWTILYSGVETTDLSKQRFDPGTKLWRSFVEKISR